MEPAEKLSITVTPAMARMIREKVENGSFGSVSEVIHAALRALQREEEEHAERIASIRARVKASLADTRPAISSDEAIARIKNNLAELAKASDLNKNRNG